MHSTSGCIYAYSREHALHPLGLLVFRSEVFLLPLSQGYELLQQIRKRLALLDESEDLLVGDPSVWHANG